MTTQDLLNEKYKELVAAFGDLCYKRQLLDTQIDKLKLRIEMLDALAPDINSFGQKFQQGLVQKLKHLSEEAASGKQKASDTQKAPEANEIAKS